ncbi:hypothetical protein ACRJ4W_04390 [Streptomyces sp. GLT-R25]
MSGSPATVSVSPGGSEGSLLSVTLGSGSGETGGVFDGAVFVGFGVVGFVLVADGFGSVLFPVPVGLADGPVEVPAPGALLTVPPADGVTPGEGTTAPDGSAESAGSGGISTFPAGLSSCSWPSSGSQGALELPDMSVARMTTA